MYPFPVPQTVLESGYSIPAMMKILTIPNIDPGLAAALVLKEQIAPLYGDPIGQAINSYGLAASYLTPASAPRMYWPTLSALLLGGEISNLGAIQTVLLFAIANKLASPSSPTQIVDVTLDTLVSKGSFTPERLAEWYVVFQEQEFVWSSAEDELVGQQIIAAVAAYMAEH